MAEINLADDTYSLNLKDGDVLWSVDAFELVGSLQKLCLKAEDPVPFGTIVSITRSVLKSVPAEAVAAASDAKVFAIGSRVFKYMDSLGNA